MLVSGLKNNTISINSDAVIEFLFNIFMTGKSWKREKAMIER